MVLLVASECFDTINVPHFNLTLSLDQPIGQRILQNIEGFARKKGFIQAGHGTRPDDPMGPLISILGAIVSVVSGICMVLGSVGGGMAKGASALDNGGGPGMIDDIWTMFRADKGPPGIRAGFVQVLLFLFSSPLFHQSSLFRSLKCMMLEDHMDLTLAHFKPQGLRSAIVIWYPMCGNVPLIKITRVGRYFALWR